MSEYKIEESKRVYNPDGKCAGWIFQAYASGQDALGATCWIFAGQYRAPAKTPRRDLVNFVGLSW